MNNVRIIKDLRSRFVAVHALTVAIVTFLEIVGYAVLLKEGKVYFGWKSAYLRQSVIVPIMLNVITHIVERFLVFKASMNDRLKNAVIVYAALMTSVVVSICHRDFIITSCSFVFPIVQSTIFNDRKLLNRSVQVTAGTYLIVSLIMYFENKMTVLMNLNVVILFSFMIVSYLCAGISLKYSETNSQIIYNQAFDNERLKDRVRHDGMTGLYNHRSFYSILEQAMKMYHSDNIKMSLAIIDIDDFKSINDTYGHDYGDAVILTLSDIMKECCPDDKVCRYGGEEFGIIFLNKGCDEAKKTVCKILDKFSGSKYDFTDRKITFSCGMSEFDGSMSSDEFFADADGKMYQAKREGKNRIIS